MSALDLFVIMNKYEFSLVLAAEEVTAEQAHAICAAGCDDGFIASQGNVIRVNFYREAKSLESAIQTATADLAKAGFDVTRVELDPHLLATA